MDEILERMRGGAWCWQEWGYMDDIFIQHNKRSSFGSEEWIYRGHQLKAEEPSPLTWDLAHSRTDTMRSCSGWKTCPTFPMGWGSVVEVGKCPEGSRRPNSPRQPLCRAAVLGRHQGTSGWP